MTSRRSFLRPLALLLVALLLAAAAPAAAQEVRLRGLQGDALGESDLTQGATILVIWTSWSPHSRDIVERVNPLAQRWRGQARVVTVNFQEGRPAVESFLAGKGMAAPVFLDPDGSFSKKYKVTTLPCLLILKDGQVAYNGRLPDNPEPVITEALR
jgi:thiol-disulfide isomerase/thioredoxin